MDRIDQFRIFARVVDCSSFTRAADTLAIPRSTVSEAIRSLEERVGVRLLHRTTRSVAPTHDGLIFYDRCLRLLDDVDEAEALFRDSARNPVGRVGVDVPGRIGRRILLPRLPDFLSIYPDISVHVGVTDRAVNMAEENVDCVVRVGPLEDSELVARSLGVLAVVNVASPAYLAAYGRPESPDDLLRHRMVRYASPSTGRVETFDWRDHGQIRSMAMAGQVTVNSAEGLIAAARAGLGIIQIPLFDVCDDIAGNRLEEVLPGFRDDPLPLHILFPHRRGLPLRVRLFADWMAEQLSEIVMA